MKLSKAQQEIVDKMREGWALGKSSAWGKNSCWIQNGGPGKGGETRHISISTLKCLLESGAIEQIEHRYPTAIYQLTEKYRKNEG
jgi:hypothetical protein